MTRRRNLDRMTTAQLWAVVARELIRLFFGGVLLASLLLLLALA